MLPAFIGVVVMLMIVRVRVVVGTGHRAAFERVPVPRTISKRKGANQINQEHQAQCSVVYPNPKSLKGRQ
jgi:hypothetical protein